jgi:hypothetical protein
VTAALALSSPVAFAQTPIQKQLPPPTQTVNLTLEQRHVIKELLKDSDVGRAPQNLDMKVGAKVPEEVVLHDLPGMVQQKVPQIKSHKFFKVEDKVVLVDPKDRKIAEVIN